MVYMFSWNFNVTIADLAADYTKIMTMTLKVIG